MSGLSYLNTIWKEVVWDVFGHLVTYLYAQNGVDKIIAVQDLHMFWKKGSVGLNIEVVGWPGFSLIMPSIITSAWVEQKVKNELQQFELVWSGVLMHISL